MNGRVVVEVPKKASLGLAIRLKSRRGLLRWPFLFLFPDYQAWLRRKLMERRVTDTSAEALLRPVLTDSDELPSAGQSVGERSIKDAQALYLGPFCPK